MNPLKNELIFDHVAQLRWLLLVAACAVIVVYGLAARSRALRIFIASGLGDGLINVSRPRQILKAVLVLLAMVCIVLALIGPRYGAFWEQAQRRRLDVVVCLDVSKSMLAQDAGMSRLDRAKDDVVRLLDQLQGGRIGLVCFAGRADLTCPLTDDLDYYRLELADAGIQSAPLGGTNIGDAIATAAKGFVGGPPGPQAIIVMTDGEDHGKSATDEAKEAKDRGIGVWTIGIGDAQRGGRIPTSDDGRPSYMMHAGELVWSKLDPRSLKRIAAAGGGEYHPSAQVAPGKRTLEWLYSEKLAPLQQIDERQEEVRRQHARFAWPAVLALALLVIETLVSERRAGSAENREGAAAILSRRIVEPVAGGRA